MNRIISRRLFVILLISLMAFMYTTPVLAETNADDTAAPEVTSTEETAAEEVTAAETSTEETASESTAVEVTESPSSVSADNPVQDKFKISPGYAIKKNHGLYDIETNKKIASGVKSFARLEYGILIVKTDNTLRYLYRTGRGQYGEAGAAGKWKSKKLLSGVKELARGTYAKDYGMSPGGGVKYFVYVVKTNGKLVKATIKLKSNTAIASCKWKTIMKNVKHAYISAEGMDGAEDASYYALKTNGRLYGWGYNEYGEIGNGKTKKVKESSPHLILKNVKSFTFAGQSYGTSTKYGTTCYAIKRSGDLYSWGINDFLTVQSGAGDAVTKPVKILEDVKCVDGASHTACAVTNDGVLWNWGTELGNYTVEGVTVIHYGIGMTPVAKDVSYADINMFNLFFIKNNKKLYYIGNGIDGEKYPKTSEPKFVAKNVTAVYTTDVNGRYYLTTKGYLYGLGFNKGGKYYPKVKLGAGYPK